MRALTQPGLKIAALTFRRRTELDPKFLRGPDGHAGKKASKTLEGDLVAGLTTNFMKAAISLIELLTKIGVRW